MEQSVNEKVGRFRKNPKIGCVVAIRGAESFDRYTVLKQGNYDTGRYGTQYDCAVFSPFMDLSTEDLWRTVALLGLDSNEIYEMYYEAGIPLVKQRIGSPINSHSGDAVKLYKVLNPGTYSKMVGRINNLDFTSAYGGVFNNGFKYIKLEQPKPFYDGIVNSKSLADALNYLGLDYNVRLINEATTSQASTEVHNTKTDPVKAGDNIRLRGVLPDFARRLAANQAREDGDMILAKFFEDNIPKEKTWYDYCKQLVNEAEPMYQKSWMPKFITSIKHWAKTGSAVNEATVIALRALSNRKDRSLGVDDYDYEEWVDWAVAGYTDITRMPIVKFFRYNQDCAENLVRAYVDAILDRWDEGGREEFEQNQYLVDIMLNGGIVPGYGPAVMYQAQPSAKEIHQCVFQKCWYGQGDKMTGKCEYWNDYLDELFVYLKDDPKVDLGEIGKSNMDISLKIGTGGFGVGGADMKVSSVPAYINIGYRLKNGDADVDGSVKEHGDPVYRTGDGRFVTENRLKEALKQFSDRFWHDEVKGSANWKRCVITCLRNDIKGTYMSFGQSSEEKLIRANALAMFAENEEERQKKIKEAQALKKKIEQEQKKQLEDVI